MNTRKTTRIVHSNLFRKLTATALTVGVLLACGGSSLYAADRSNGVMQPYGGGMMHKLSKNVPVTIESSTPVKPGAPALKNGTKLVSNSAALKSGGFAMQNLDDDPAYNAGPANSDDNETPVLRGAVTSLKVTRGRSQIVKFAQPIMRLSIADPQLADIIPLSPDQLMINGRQRGVTSLIVWDENGQEGIFDLYVQNDTTELMAAINAIAPRENINVRITDDSFILSGQVSSSVILDEIRRTAGAYGFREENFIDLTETPIPQVVLEVKIVQMNRETARDLRTSFATQGDDFTVTRLLNNFDATLIGAFGLSQQNPRSTVGLAPGQFLNALGAGTTAPLNLPFDRGVRFFQASDTFGGLTSTFAFGNSIEGALDFLQNNGKASVLAEPKLVATHGRTSAFLSGGEFPYTSGTDQNGSPIISFREFGVKLEFTPWVNIRTGLIELRIAPEVSSIDTANCIQTAGGQVCGILKRTAESTVQLHDSESLMIAGILTREENNAFQAVPFMGELPIIGKLFKNGTYRKLNTELVIIVTPHVLDKSDFGKYFEKS